jgi:hypothetical protein
VFGEHYIPSMENANCRWWPVKRQHFQRCPSSSIFLVTIKTSTHRFIPTGAIFLPIYGLLFSHLQSQI